eukprot:5573176-Alexandrium_andersonii.AAC.1
MVCKRHAPRGGPRVAWRRASAAARGRLAMWASALAKAYCKSHCRRAVSTMRSGSGMASGGPVNCRTILAT